MKAVKFIFAFSFLFMAFTSCTSDNLAEDEALYSQELFATGEETSATVNNSRD